jgi:methylated-DNA-[protein]-cysteine S-methyltransferase
MNTYYATLDSPLGELVIVTDGAQLTELKLDGAPPRDAVCDPKLLKPSLDELRAYLAGELTVFTLSWRQSGSPFQERVWKELTKIPYGETIGYAELARRAGNPRAFRAAGSANGRNRIAIVVPCHRVVNTGGAIGGYGGGIWRKQWLLDLEAKSRRR